MKIGTKKLVKLAIVFFLVTFIYYWATIPSVVLNYKIVNETDCKVKSFVINVSSNVVIKKTIDAKNSQYVQLAKGDDSAKIAEQKFIIIALDELGAILCQVECRGEDIFEDNTLFIYKDK